MTDILMELTVEEIEQLAGMYESRKSELPHLPSFFATCLKSKKMLAGEMRHFVQVYSPNSRWKEDGTFVAVIPNYGYDIVAHSLDRTGTSLLEALRVLRCTRTIDFPPGNFYALHEQFVPQVTELLTAALGFSPLSNELNFWCLRKERALELDYIVPTDVRVKPLDPQDIPLIVSVWPHKYPNCDKRLLDYITLTPGLGVYLKATGQLVSWVLVSCLGQMTALQTLDGHKKKGYAALVVKVMAKQLAVEGFDCCGTVIPGNVASEILMRKLGFERLFKVAYVLTLLHKKQ